MNRLGERHDYPTDISGLGRFARSEREACRSLRRSHSYRRSFSSRKLSLRRPAQLLGLPSNLGELERFYSLTPAARGFIAGHRTQSNRIRVAVQLCFLRYPGRAWTPEDSLPAPMLRWIVEQVSAYPSSLQGYAERDQIRRKHFIE